MNSDNYCGAVIDAKNRDPKAEVKFKRSDIASWQCSISCS